MVTGSLLFQSLIPGLLLGGLYALLAAGLTLSAAAPSLGLLVLARALTGAAFAAVVPGALVYVGDALDASRRHGPLTDLMRAMAVGTALATVVGAVVGDALGWRAVLVLPGLLALLSAWSMRAMPEPARAPDGSERAAFGTVARSGRARAMLLFAFVEGALLLGLLPLLPAVLQVGGMSVTSSGAVVAAYGVGLVVLARVVKALSATVPPERLMAVGALMGIGAHRTLTLSRGGPRSSARASCWPGPGPSSTPRCRTG